MTKKRYASKIAETVHKTAAGLHRIGAVDKTTMRDFDRMCLTKTEKLTATEIRAIREHVGVSQAVFAEHLGVSKGLISKWECGDKSPSRMALKLLAIVKAKGIDVIA